MKLSTSFTLSIVAAGALSLNTVGIQSPAYSCPACPVSSSSLHTDQTIKVKESSQATFAKDVLESKQLVLVDFYATWCGPCKRMAPIVETLSKAYGGKISVIKVDVDKNPQLANQYEIISIPAIRLFKSGQVIDGTIGVTSLAELREKVDKAL